MARNKNFIHHYYIFVIFFIHVSTQQWGFPLVKNVMWCLLKFLSSIVKLFFIHSMYERLINADHTVMEISYFWCKKKNFGWFQIIKIYNWMFRLLLCWLYLMWKKIAGFNSNWVHLINLYSIMKIMNLSWKSIYTWRTCISLSEHLFTLHPVWLIEILFLNIFFRK